MKDIYELFERIVNVMNMTGLDFEQALELVRLWEEIKR